MSDGVALALLEQLRQCDSKSREADVDLESYIACWGHLKEVLNAMGSVFKFVSSDVEDKG